MNKFELTYNLRSNNKLNKRKSAVKAFQFINNKLSTNDLKEGKKWGFLRLKKLQMSTNSK